MENKEEMLRALAHKTMFTITDKEMPALLEEYDIFMHHVKVLENIDTSQVEPLAYPYEGEIEYLRSDEPSEVLSVQEVLFNAKEVEDNQIKVPKVVG